MSDNGHDNVDKKSMLKELVDRNINPQEFRQRMKAKQVVYRDTLNLESFAVFLLILGLFLYFVNHSSVVGSPRKQSPVAWRLSAAQSFIPGNHSHSLTDLFSLGISTIIIDPGHGGKDPGAVSETGLMEKDVVLDISMLLRDMLLKNTLFNVVLTREKDVTLDLESRAVLANHIKADLFISLHLNSSPKKSLSGVETFVLGLTEDSDSLDLVTMENLSQTLTLYEMSEILEKMKTSFVNDESIQLAQTVQNSLSDELKQYNKRFLNIGIKKAPFIVLAKTTMPSILVEASFLSNHRDEELLKTQDYRKSIAKGVYIGIKQYLERIKNSNGR